MHCHPRGKNEYIPAVNRVGVLEGLDGTITESRIPPTARRTAPPRRLGSKHVCIRLRPCRLRRVVQSSHHPLLGSREKCRLCSKTGFRCGSLLSRARRRRSTWWKSSMLFPVLRLSSYFVNLQDPTSPDHHPAREKNQLSRHEAIEQSLSTTL